MVARLSAVAISTLLLTGTTQLLSNEEVRTRILVASCADDEKPDHPIWTAMVDSSPNAVIFVGDNIYATRTGFETTGSQKILEQEYARLRSVSGFQTLMANSRVFATWDDHDYGMNDAGAENPHKEISRSVFLNFWGFPAEHAVRQTPGIYHFGEVREASKLIRIILLDTRFFRSQFENAPLTGRCVSRNIVENRDPKRTILGAEQWHWLTEQLQSRADLHLIVSSIQVIPSEHCFERWSALALERERLFQTIRENKVQNVLIVSGDRHLGEISALPSEAELGVGFPLYELTSSPLSARSGFGEGEPNRFRVLDDNIRTSNFGLVDINWTRETISLSLNDQEGQTLQSHEFSLRVRK